MKILIALHPSKILEDIVRVASKLTSAFGAKAVVLYVEPEIPSKYLSHMAIPGGGIGKHGIRRIIDECVKQELKNKVDKILKEHGIKAYKKIRRGDIAVEVLDEVKRGYDLVVCGVAGFGGLMKSFIGSPFMKIAEYSEIPTLVVKRYVEIRRILACTDGSPYSEKAIRFAGKISKKLNAKLFLLSVARDLLEEDEAASNVKRGLLILEKEQVKSEPIVKIGGVRDTIISESKSYDLVVLGSRGLSKLKRLLLGHVSLYVLSQMPTNVLIVRW